MPSKIRKAIGVVKDQTSISLAKVSATNSSNLEVAILKATSHDEIPVDERYVKEVLFVTSSNKFYASITANALARRIGRTRNWVVALKSLMLVLRLFQDGDPYFAREVLHTMKKGSKIVNLSSFRDGSSNSSPWDYTAFIRTFALYLDERLNCFLKGKLQRRMTLKDDTKHDARRSSEPVRDMKPAMLLDRMFYWQRLLDRAVATQPTGAAKANRLVQISLYAIVHETYDLYRDVSGGLGLLLDSFFHLQYQSCVDAFNACVKASKQFEELGKFYTLCKGIGVGRMSEYPSVRTISQELLDTLGEFLKDQNAIPNTSTSNSQEGSEMRSKRSPGGTKTCLEDLMSGPNGGTDSMIDKDQGSLEEEQPPCVVEDLIDVSSPPGSTRTSSTSIDYNEQNLEHPLHDLICISIGDGEGGATTSSTSPGLVAHQSNISSLSTLDLGLLFDDQEQRASSVSGSDYGGREGWELMLVENNASDATNPANNNDNNNNAPSIGFEPSFFDSLYNQASSSTSMYNQSDANYVNPFLNGENDELALTLVPANDANSIANSPAFDVFSATYSPFQYQVNPGFCGQNPNGSTPESEMKTHCDPFSTWQSPIDNSSAENRIYGSTPAL
ncbi:hypothetical protein Scep_012732 [Stephania cephalantha]|uniref:ENTH domain-containing protein n=1 Tax=Stephania cephalantha TaxID=152367 RepID=A0AAP0JFY2_9MAGN